MKLAIQILVLTLWTIIGFVVWVPMLIRASLLFTFQVCANSVTGQSLRGLGHPVKFAATFYAKTFRDILKALSDDDEDTSPAPSKVPWNRLASELAWATICWVLLLSLPVILGSGLRSWRWASSAAVPDSPKSEIVEFAIAHQNPSTAETSDDFQEDLKLLGLHGDRGTYVQGLVDAGDPKSLTQVYNALAWHWAVCDNPAHRNIHRATKYLNLALRRDTDDCSNIRDTTAAVWAAEENFSAAVSSLERTLESRSFFNPGPLTDDELKRQMRLRLELYKSQKPYTEVFP